MMGKRYQPPVLETKDGDDDPTKQTREPDVHAAVLKEVAAIGENSKKAVDELGRAVATLHKTVDEIKGEADAATEQKLSKLAEDILTRQEALETGNTKRMDDLDLALQRIAKGGGSGGPEGDLFKEAKDFRLSQLIVQKKLTIENLADESQIDTAGFAEFCKHYHLHLRRDDKNISPEVHKFLSVGSDPDGGILVPPQMSARVVERVYELDAMRQLASVESISTGALDIPLDQDEAGDGWIGEVETGDETTTPQRGMKRIPVHTQYARPRVTQELLDDAAINIEQWLANKIASKFGRSEGAAFITGDGIKRPRGILTYDSGTSFRTGQIEQTATGAAAAITTDGLIDIKFSLLEDYLARASWLLNRLTIAEIMKLKDGDGQYIWRAGLSEGTPSILLGLPTRMSTTMPVVAAGALSIAIADWAEAYTIVDRQGISVLRDPYTVKPLVEFYTRKRVGGDVVNHQALKLGVVSA